MIKLKLTPNENSKCEMGGKAHYEYVELARADEGGPPWALVHVDIFHDLRDLALYHKLLKGTTVKVELTMVDPWTKEDTSNDS